MFSFWEQIVRVASLFVLCNYSKPKHLSVSGCAKSWNIRDSLDALNSFKKGEAIAIPEHKILCLGFFKLPKLPDLK